eukprot:TRINITY_DN1634_c2_g1_i1.p1 TRINITY_DN1634_c2_g1~~TRINITY_DN1634_c2_g1_i1.p1  ORF type:complete len:746 (+),score=88.28 TRINITY_DN1634_c2_g1_i1:644-2881(+)
MLYGGVSNMGMSSCFGAVKFNIATKHCLRCILSGPVPTPSYADSIISTNPNTGVMWITGATKFSAQPRPEGVNDSLWPWGSFVVSTLTSDPSAYHGITWANPVIVGNSPSYDRVGHTAVFLGDRLFCFGGSIMNKCLNDLLVIDTNSLSMTRTESTNKEYAPHAVTRATAQFVGNKLYIFSGKDSDGKLTNNLSVLKVTDHSAKPDTTNTSVTTSTVNTDTSNTPLSSGTPVATATPSSSPNPKFNNALAIPAPGSLFKKAFNNKEMFPDVEFRLGDRSYFAHKVILSSASLVFSKRFSARTKKSHNSKKKKGDESDDSVSQFDTHDSLETFKLPDYWSPDIFCAFLEYIYTGRLILSSKKDASEVGEIAFEFLIDPLMKFCQITTEFPAIYDEPLHKFLRRYRRCVGNPIGSDVSFVFDRQSRLLAHKVFLRLFSEHFGQELGKNKGLKYFEIDGEVIQVESFIDFLKLLYNGFDPMGFNPKMDPAALLVCAVEFQDSGLIDMMSKSNSFSENNVAQIYLAGKQKQLVSIMKSAERFIESQFESIVRDEALLKEWDEDLLKHFTEALSGPFEDWCGFANWLDVLWFGHHTKNADLRKAAAQNLQGLINVENVIGIITAAHTAGEKELRSACVTFLVVHGMNVEEYQRMQSKQGGFKIGDLSQSVRVEVEGRVKATVKDLHQLKKEEITKVGFLQRRKQTCSLCKRVLQKEQLSKKQVPAVFGPPKKLKPVCKSCDQLTLLLGGK